MKQYTIVEFLKDHPTREKYVEQFGEYFIFFGKIPNMSGHCLLMEMETKKMWVLETRMFVAKKESK